VRNRECDDKSLRTQEQRSIPVISSEAATRPFAVRNQNNLEHLELPSRTLENNMREKFLAGTAAVFLTGCAVLATAAPASAQARWHRGGFWPGAVAAGVIGGAVAAATSPLWAPGYYDYYPGYAPGPYYDYYAAAPAAPVAGADASWCQAHFRSYNPTTGTYLGFDGQYHSCP
jgi:hypothetical protein